MTNGVVVGKQQDIHNWMDRGKERELGTVPGIVWMVCNTEQEMTCLSDTPTGGTTQATPPPPPTQKTHGSSPQQTAQEDHSIRF